MTRRCDGTCDTCPASCFYGGDDDEDYDPGDDAWFECERCGEAKTWSFRRAKLVCPSCDEDGDLEDEW